MNSQYAGPQGLALFKSHYDSAPPDGDFLIFFKHM
jgi:hypothetical protein